MRLFLFIFLRSFCASYGQYEVPDALVEVFQPRGLRVSIPDEDGIKLFAFHGKVNEEMEGREGGTFSKDVLKPKNGRWTFYDPYAKLKTGDILYYWTYVDYFDGKNKLGYANDDQKFVVTELLSRDGASTASSCGRSPTAVKEASACAQKLIFSDDFDTLDSWDAEIKFAAEPDYEFVLYGNRRENMAVKDGHLEIRPLPTDELYGEGFVTNHTLDLGNSCTGKVGTTDCLQTPQAFLILPPVTSSQLTTKNKFSFKYGKIEIRAQLPKGDWIYPELYLNPKNHEYGPGYASGQIRIAFIPGNDKYGKSLQGGCILGSSRTGRRSAIKTTAATDFSWCDNFHTFAVTWKPDEIVLSVDGNVYGVVSPPEGGFAALNPGKSEKWGLGSKLAPFDKEMYLTVGVGVGGHSFDDSDTSKPWVNNDPKNQKNFYRASHLWRPTWGESSVLKVDYIKVWAL